MRLNRVVLVRALRKSAAELGRAAEIGEIAEAETGEEALRLITSGGFDVAILDNHFGDSVLTGRQVAARIRELERSAALPGRMTIVGCSGDSGRCSCNL